jgi:hypothetical protein
MARVTKATYDFAGSGALSGDWTVTLNDFNRSNGHGNGDTNDESCMADYTGRTWANDQWSACECYSLASWDKYINASVRGTDEAGENVSLYLGTTDGNSSSGLHCGILEFNNEGPTGGTWLTDIAQDFNDTDYGLMEAIGTALVFYRSTDGGSSYSSVSSTTDATHASGDVGNGTWGDGEIVDNWSGGEISDLLPLVQHRRRMLEMS